MRNPPPLVRVNPSRVAGAARVARIRTESGLRCGLLGFFPADGDEPRVVRLIIPAHEGDFFFDGLLGGPDEFAAAVEADFRGGGVEQLHFHRAVFLQAHARRLARINRDGLPADFPIVLPAEDRREPFVQLRPQRLVTCRDDRVAASVVSRK